MNTRGAQLRRTVRHSCNLLKRVQSAEVVCVFDWRSSYTWKTRMAFSETENRCSWKKRNRLNRNTSVTWKGGVYETKSVSAKYGCNILDPDIPEKSYKNSSRVPSESRPRRRGCHSNESNEKAESSGAGRSLVRTAETQTSTKPDHSTGAPLTYLSHLARGKCPTAIGKRGHYSTPQGEQDGVRKPPRYLARVTHG